MKRAKSSKPCCSHWLAGFHIDADCPDAVVGGQLLHQDPNFGLDKLVASTFQESSFVAHFIQLVSNDLEKREDKVEMLFVQCMLSGFRVCWFEFYRDSRVFCQLFLHFFETPLAQPAQARKLRVMGEMRRGHKGKNGDVGKAMNTKHPDKKTL